MEELIHLYNTCPESKGRIDDKCNLTWNQVAALMRQFVELKLKNNVVSDDVRLSLLERVKEIAFGDGSAQERMVDIKALFSNEE